MVRTLIGLILLFCSSAFAAPTTFVYQGQIIKPDSLPLEAASVDFTVEIYTDDGNECLLYEETHNLNMTGTSGVFSLTIGSGTRSGASYEDTSTIPQILNNSQPMISALTCTVGTTYTPASGDKRRMRVTFNDGGGPVTVANDHVINSVPYAEYASRVGGLEAADILQVNTTLPQVLSQANLEWVFENTRFPELQALIGGTSTQYISSTPTATVDFNGQVLDGLGAPVDGDDATTKNYVDGQIAGQNLDASITGIGAGQDGFVLSWDNANSRWEVVAQNTNDTTKLARDGSNTMSGNLPLNGNYISHDGGAGEGLTFDTTGNGTFGQDVTVTGGIGVTNGINSAGDINLETQSELRLQDDAGGEYVGLQAPTGTTSYTMELPNAAGAANQILKLNASGNLIWAADDDAAEADTLSSVTGRGATTTDNILLDTEAELRLGDNAGGDYVGLKAPATTTTYTMELPNAAGATNQILKLNASGNLIWAADDDAAEADTLSSVTGRGATTTDNILLDTEAELRLGDNAGGDYVGLKAPATTTTYTMELPNAAPAANQILKANASGNLIWAADDDTAEADTLATVTGRGATTTDNITLDSEAELRLADNAGGDYIGLKAPATTTTYTMELPSAAGATNQILKLNASGNLVWANDDAAAAGTITDGGNTLAQVIELGTADGFAVNLRTNGTDRLSVDTSGNTNLLSQGELRLQDDAGGDYVGLRAPTGTTSYTMDLPNAAGATNQILKLNASGNLIWAADDDSGGTGDILNNGNAGAVTVGSNDNTFDLESNGTSRMQIEADGDINMDSNTLFVDESTDRVGIGTDTPLRDLHLSRGDGGTIHLGTAGDTAGDVAALDFVTLAGDTNTLNTAPSRGWEVVGRGDAFSNSAQQNDLLFSYWDGSSWYEVFQLDSANRDVIVRDSSVLKFDESSGTDTIGISAPATVTASYSMELPPAAGATNQILKLNASGNLVWSADDNSGGTGDILNNGNAGAVTVGSNDNTFDLESNGTSRMQIEADGDINMDSNTLFIDESTDRVGIGTITPGSKLAIDGRIRFGDNTASEYGAIFRDSSYVHIQNDFDTYDISVDGVLHVRTGGAADGEDDFVVSGDGDVAMDGILQSSGAGENYFQGELSVGATNSGDSKLQVVDTKTDTSGSHYGILSTIAAKPTAASTGYFYGSRSRAYHDDGNSDVTFLAGAQGYALKTTGGTTQFIYGVSSSAINQGTAGSVSRVIGSNNTAITDAATAVTTMTVGSLNTSSLQDGTSTSVYGSRNIANSFITGTQPNLQGATAEVQNQSTGTVTDSYGLYSDIRNFTTGTLTNAYGIYTELDNPSGTVNNYYGVYTQDTSGLTTADNFAIYTNGNVPSYFGGSVGIGTENPGANLDVNGNAQIRSEMRLSDADDGEYVGFAAPSAVTTSYSMELPAAAGATNQILKLNASGNLIWAADDTGAAGTITDGGNTLTQTIELGTNDNFALNLRTNGTDRLQVDTSGNTNVLSQGELRFQDDTGGDYIGLQAPTGTTSYTMQLPNAAGSTNQILKLNASGNLVWAADDDSGGTGDLNDGGNNGAIIVGSNDNTLALESNNTTALSFDTSQNGTFASDANVTSNLNLLTQGEIRFQDDAGGDYVALQAPTGVTTYTMELPNAAGSTNQILKLNASGNLVWAADDDSGGTGDILNNGNSGAVTVGSNDSTFDLESNGTSRMQIEADGDINIDANTLFVDESTNRVGIGTDTVNYPLEVLTDGSENGILIQDSATTRNLSMKVGATGYSEILSTNTDLVLQSTARIHYESRGGPWAIPHRFTLTDPLTGTANHDIMRIDGTWAPTSGSNAFKGLIVVPTVNQTGTASGNYTGIEVDVQETAVLGTDNRLIDLQTGNTTRFAVQRNGNVLMEQQSSNPTGIAGYNSFFARDDGKLYYRDGVSAPVEITTGSGGASDVDGLSDGVSDGTADSIYIGDAAGTGATVDRTFNTALGHDALDAMNHDDADHNTAIGRRALTDLTSGNSNTAVGSSAVDAVTTAQYTVGIGRDAAGNVSTGDSNTAVGTWALATVSTGTANTSVGYLSMQDATGNYNTAVGRGALVELGGGNDNVALGDHAGRGTDGVTTGNRNVFLGYESGYAIGAGADDNIFIGNQSGYTTTTGDNNIIIGSGVDASSATVSNELNIGNVIRGTVGADGDINIEDELRLDNDANDNYVALKAPDGSSSTVTFTLPDTAGTAGHVLRTDGTGTLSWVAASGGASDIDGLSDAIYDGTDFSYYIGTGSGGSAANADNNVAVGYNALAAVTDGDDLTAIGASALAANDTGAENTAVGSSAMLANTSGSDNAAFGHGALSSNETGNNNTALGDDAGPENETGSNNVFVGRLAGQGADGLSNISNTTVMGYRAGAGMRTGADNNIMIGYQAGDATTTGSSNIIIGSDVDASSATASNELNIGDVIRGTVGADGDVNIEDELRLDNDANDNYVALKAPDGSSSTVTFTLPDTAGSNNQVLTTDGTGTLSWATAGGANALDDLSDANTSTGTNNWFVGSGAGNGTLSGTNNLALGLGAGAGLTTGDRNIAIGENAGAAVDAESDSVAIGYQAGLGAGLSSTVIIGSRAGDAATSLSNSVIIGDSAMGAEDSVAAQNVVIGDGAMQFANTATNQRNVVVGNGALAQNGTGYNTVLGSSAATNIDSGGYNVIIGDRAGEGSASATAANNVAIGFRAGTSFASGGADDNILLGFRSGDEITTGDNNIVIGYDIDTSGATASNELNIGALIFGNGVDGADAAISSGNVGIGVRPSSGEKLEVAGDIRTTASLRLGDGDNSNYMGFQAPATVTSDVTLTLPDGAGSSGQVLTTDGTGTLSWATAGGASDIDGLSDGVYNSTAQSVFLGTGAGTSVSADDLYNVGVGYNALNSNTNSDYNTAVGWGALQDLVNGGQNTAVGESALQNVVGTYNNTGVGTNVHNDLVIGNDNTSVGYAAGWEYNNAYRNTFIGTEAAAGTNTSSDGDDNVVVGYRAAYVMTSGINNTMLGTQAGVAATSADNNIFIGYQAGETTTTGDNNIIIGSGVDASAAGASNELNIGNLIRGTVGADGDVNIEDELRLDNDANDNYVALKAPDGSSSTVTFTLPDTAGTAGHVLRTDGTGTLSWVAASGGASDIDGLSDAIYDAVDNSYYIGTNSGGSHVDADDNTAVGYNALASVTDGDDNTAFGYDALRDVTTGNRNTAFGSGALANVTGTLSSTAVGWDAAANSTGHGNTAIGADAIFYNTSGTQNVALGESAGQGSSGAAKSANVEIGYRAGYANNSGDDNILIGWQAGDSLVSGDGNIVIGYDADVSGGTAANELNIGGAITGDLASGDVTVARNLNSVGQVYSGQNVIASGATVDFNDGNIQILQSVGGTAITLNNMMDGGTYTLIVTDTTSREYTFTNCTNTHFAPASAATTSGTQTTYTIMKVTISSATHCYISWITGFTP